MRIMLALALLLGVAHADARYMRKQPTVVVPKPHVKPKAAVAVPKPLTADEVFAIEADKQPIKQRQEALLIKLVRDTPDDDADKPDYLFRLAELYAQQQRYWRLKATEP
jgi:hypothetical protein